LTTGVLFQSPFKDYTLTGASDTDCFIATGFDRTLFETPQLCTHFELFPTGNSDLPAAISLGMDGNQGSISTIVNLTQFYSDWLVEKIFLLPVNQFPIALATDAMGGVYVGMHDTGGILPPPAPSQVNQELVTIYKYHRQMTYPNQTIQVVSPQLIRVNILTGKTDWQLELATTEGRSTIGGVVHLPSRNLVVVAGSSTGRGNLVGANEWSNSWDGYVTLVNATSGKVDDNAASDTPGFLADYSLRVQSQVGQDDFIHGICATDDNLLVLGSTTGVMTSGASTVKGGAFVRMLDVDTFQVKWTRQWSGMGTEALKCTATLTSVYVAGHVPAGVVVDDEKRNLVSSTQDLFVSRLDTLDGTVRWTRQIDSRRHDAIANIFIAPTGNLIIAHNAIDFERGVNEVITSTVSNADGFHDWQDLPQHVDPLGGRTPGLAAIQGPTEDKARRTRAIVISTILVATVVLLMVTFYGIRRRNSMLHQEGPESKELENDLALQDVPDSTPEPSDACPVHGGVGVV
jgi:hypothetical protein